MGGNQVIMLLEANSTIGISKYLEKIEETDSKQFEAIMQGTQPITLPGHDDDNNYLAFKYAGKKSLAHEACVVGDTVGDPLKDTSGPALNIVMKLMAIISVVFADTFISINNGHGIFNIKPLATN